MKKNDKQRFDSGLFHHDLISPSQGPSALSKKIGETLYGRIKRELRPSVLMVGTRLTGAHLLSSALTLSVCPQFGVRLLGSGHGIMALFMPLGMLGCFFLCGALYLGFTVFMARLVLSRPDWRVVRNHYALFMGGLALVSLLAFSLIQGQFYLNLSLFWFVGAMIAAYGALIFERKLFKAA